MNKYCSARRMRAHYGTDKVRYAGAEKGQKATNAIQSFGKKLKKAALAAALFALAAMAAAIIARPEKYIAKCAEGIALWAQCVLPALLPFMVICALVLNSGAADKVSRPLHGACSALKLPGCAAACLVMGAASGYPAGSRMVYRFYAAGLTDGYGAKKLAYMCSLCGPLFTIGTVGGMFGYGGHGAKLYAAHIVAVLVPAIIFSLAGKKCNAPAPDLKRSGNLLEESFYGAVQSALTAGAFIVFFYTAAAIAQDFYILYPFERLFNLFMDEGAAQAAAYGLIEMTGGCAALVKSGSALALPLCGFTITFGGASVLLQQLTYLTKAGVRPLKFIGMKLLQAVLCLFILLAIG